MPLNTVQKQQIIQDFQTTKSDTGSPEVQIALLSHRNRPFSRPFKNA